MARLANGLFYTRLRKPIHVESGLNFNLDDYAHECEHSFSSLSEGDKQSTNMFAVGHYRTHFQYGVQQ